MVLMFHYWIYGSFMIEEVGNYMWHVMGTYVGMLHGLLAIELLNHSMATCHVICNIISWT
jgi:hypothetical protein